MVPLTHATFTALMTSGEMGAIDVCGGKYNSTKSIEAKMATLTTAAIRT
jgi:hypothetical protein